MGGGGWRGAIPRPLGGDGNGGGDGIGDGSHPFREGAERGILLPWDGGGGRLSSAKVWLISLICWHFGRVTCLISVGHCDVQILRGTCPLRKPASYPWVAGTCEGKPAWYLWAIVTCRYQAASVLCESLVGIFICWHFGRLTCLISVKTNACTDIRRSFALHRYPVLGDLYPPLDTIYIYSFI